MKTTEIRVKPVVRHIVTRYTEGGPEGEGENRALLETLGEFANESYAEQVAGAMRGAVQKPMQYAIVERSFDTVGRVFYAECPEQAKAYKQQLEKFYGTEFRMFSREITDPVVLAHRSLGPAGWSHLDLQGGPARDVGRAFARALKADTSFSREIHGNIFERARDRGMDVETAESLANCLMDSLFGIPAQAA